MTSKRNTATAQGQDGLLETKRKDSFNIDPRKIEINPQNPRIDYGTDEEQAEMADSIRTNGVLQPIKVYRKPGTKDRYILIDGHRRLRGSMTVVSEGQELRIPAILRDKPSDEELLCEMLVTGTNAKPLTPVEQAIVVHKLINNFKREPEEIAKMLGKSRGHISNLRQLALVDEDVKQYLLKGEVTTNAVLRALRNTNDMGKVSATVNEIVESNKRNGGKGRVTSSMIAVDSVKELKAFVKRMNDMEPTTNPELFKFAKDLAENKLNTDDFAFLFLGEEKPDITGESKGNRRGAGNKNKKNQPTPETSNEDDEAVKFAKNMKDEDFDLDFDEEEELESTF
jgi:ParB/RepB/Spo0J family partition protein